MKGLMRWVDLDTGCSALSGQSFCEGVHREKPPRVPRLSSQVPCFPTARLEKKNEKKLERSQFVGVITSLPRVFREVYMIILSYFSCNAIFFYSERS